VLISRKRILLAVTLCLALLLAYGLYFELPQEPLLPGSIVEREVMWEGNTRTYTLYKPEQLSSAPALVFVFHGSGGDAQQSRGMYGYSFDQLAEEEGFIVVYAEGYEKHYNGCRKAGPYAANELQIDDVGFMRLLAANLIAEFNANPQAVFATGVSNGGQMALRLALEAPDLVAAVAPVATSMPTPDNMDCTATGEAVAFLLMNGTNDPMNPYDGGTVALYGLLGDRGKVQSSMATAQYWAQLAGHDSVATQRNLPDNNEGDGSTVNVSQWNTPGKKPVALFTISGGGHNAPHPQIKLPKLLGGTNNDIDAAREIWSFFKRATDS